MAQLTISRESALTEAGNSVLTSSVFYGLAAHVGLCACVLHVTTCRYSTLTHSKHRNPALARKQRMVILAQNSAVSRAMKLGPDLQHEQLQNDD